MKKIHFLLFLCLSFIIVITANDNFASAEESDSYTFGEVEKNLVDYLNSSGENYEVGSKEYTDFIFDQFNNDTDKKLVKRSDYRAITAYMSEYVYQYSLKEESINKTTKTSTFDLGEIKNLTIGELKEQILEEEVASEKAAEINRARQPVELASTYSVSNAKGYAERWYNGRNPAFPVYSNDCTNYVSQILFAGGMKMSGDWYAEMSYSGPAWRLVPEFYTYWSNLKSTTTSSNKSTIISNAKEGDIVQFKKDGATRWSHSMFVYEKADGTLYLSGHTDDYLKRDFKNVSSTWVEFRVIKM